MHRGTYFWVAVFLLATPGYSQKVAVDPKCPSEPKDTRYECTYEIVFTPAAKSDKYTFTFQIPMLDSLSATLEPKPDEVEIVGRSVKWVFKPQKLNSEGMFEFKLTIDGSERLVKKGTRSWRATFDGSSDKTGKTDGLVARYDPSLIRPVMAAGLNRLLDDTVDFKITEIDAQNGGNKQEFLDTVNDSRLRANATLGALFKTPIKNVDFLTGLDFTDDTQDTLDGFTFGVGIRVTKYLEFVAGFSLRRGRELSKGFRAEVERLVSGQRANETGVDLARFQPILEGDDKFFDGFPLTNQNGMRWFPSDPTRESFNSSLIFGVGLPIDLLDLFRRGNNSE